ncbi:Phosphotransferase enzyme family protein [Micromonospora pallida]|uniref:Phosphotransferase enzyme family protein n=1 Tax=Micromonospora pallida TaxID=145854 RepID=A0A1C6RUK2_9ACTN|nr:aminoglycoside phosphotransferase family protein [Micromonospora pallida]SCL20804.1 Phosphotransferase enzyme family protein [Micromonospora pallida]
MNEARLRRVVAAVDSGRAQALDGRGVNRSFRLVDGDRHLSVKVHCASRSTDAQLLRIRRIDALLRGIPWYPCLMDAALVGSRLVVIRPFAPGAPPHGALQHVGRLVGVLGDLADHGFDPGSEELVGDYATPWLSGWERERQAVVPVLAGERGDLAQAIDEHGAALRAGAARLTCAKRAMAYHGDLHGRNFIVSSRGQLTVIDWDEAGFSRRPADVGKALWLSCRRERGDFVLDADAVQDFLARVHARMRLPYPHAGDLALLGGSGSFPR